MDVSAFGALIVLAVLAGLVLFLMALVDLLRRPTETWESSGQT